MRIEGAVCVVTGGGSGIGRSLAIALARRGAAAVVVGDLNLAGAQETVLAAGTGVAVAADVSARAGNAALLDAAGAPVDLFCANAGVFRGQQLGDDDAWELSLAVNVRAHVEAARLLVPGWLERGSGHFLSTASAAGLTNQVGNAAYGVTKHAAVGFAEWLALTYGDRGVGVTCLCPMGVDTPMLENDIGGFMESVGAIATPGEVADVALDAVEAGRFLALPHPEVAEFHQRKAADYERWLRGMQRLRQRSGT